MKSFLGQFKSSAKELKNVRTLTTTGILIAMAMILKMFTIDISTVLRISFPFLAITIIAMLYGPVVCAMSTLTIDILGYIVNSGKSTGAYYPPLGMVVVIAGIIYGMLLYKKKPNIVNISIAKVSVNVICNICFNSYFIYTGFVNKGFSILDKGDWNAFFAWVVPRVIKNVAMLPIEIIMMLIILPIAYIAYNKVYKFRQA